MCEISKSGMNIHRTECNTSVILDFVCPMGMGRVPSLGQEGLANVNFTLRVVALNFVLPVYGKLPSQAHAVRKFYH